MGPDGKYEYLLDEPIRPRVTDDEAADVRECAQRCLAVSERYVKQYPEQWYVFRPVWDAYDNGPTLEDRQELRKRRAQAMEASS